MDKNPRRFMVCEVQEVMGGIGAIYWDTTDPRTVSRLCLIPVEAVATLEFTCFKDAKSGNLVYVYNADTYIVRNVHLPNGETDYRLMRKDEQP